VKTCNITVDEIVDDRIVREIKSKASSSGFIAERKHE